MNIGEEKAHIYHLMSEITSERRKLTEMYYDLKARLDELNKLEIRGLDDLSLKGYVDLYNNREKELKVANIKREMGSILKKVEEKPVIKEDIIIPKKEIEKEKDKLKKRSSQINLDKVIGLITTVLKETGTPMNVKAIYKQVINKSDMDIKLPNFRNNILPRACQRNKKIQKAMRGYYQYIA